jgi:CheY-like chemotaxis protein
MVDRTEFERQVKDALTNINDYAALETHPLAAYFPPTAGKNISRGEYLRELLLDAINKLQPPDRPTSTISIEWRPYIILKGRYVEAKSLPDLKDNLMLSGRQLRREHGRALRAVATLLWDQAFAESQDAVDADTVDADGGDNDFGTFEITREALDLAEIVNEVAGIFQQRAKSEGVELKLQLAESLPPVLADRIVLRQILLSLFSYALHIQSGPTITAGAEIDDDEVTFWIQSQVDEREMAFGDVEQEDTALQFARYWSQRLGATHLEIHPPEAQSGIFELYLTLPQPGQGVALIVDDQETALRMFERYLSQTNFKVVGIKDAGQVIPLARQLKPQVITLDVMMPTLDGWEILQTLQSDPETQDIPIIVCSVWDEPELAFSLGAAEFLKKPVTQKQLLDALAQLKLLAQ